MSNGIASLTQGNGMPKTPWNSTFIEFQRYYSEDFSDRKITQMPFLTRKDRRYNRDNSEDTKVFVLLMSSK